MPKTNPLPKRLGDLVKDDSVIVGPLRRHFEATGPDDQGRRADCVHPSALSRDDFCPRASYYEITGAPITAPPATSFRLHQIFDEGHRIHDKWQQKLWSMGVLKGDFGCLACLSVWSDCSPQSCPWCGRERRALVYKEVSVDGDDYMIHGKADGWVGDDLLEFKSAGQGTFRMEAPDLYARHTHTVDLKGTQRTWVDLEGMWRDFHRPIRTHLRQGQLYLHFTGLKRIVFIYEAKWDQSYKEFVVRYQPQVVEPLLKLALLVKSAVEAHEDSGPQPPRCPHGGCALCRSYEETDAPHQPLSAARARSDSGPGRDRHGRVPAPRKAPLRPPQSATQSFRYNR